LKSAAAPYLLVGAGGFVGAIARYAVARVTGSLVETSFPFATFIINVGGSFLLGVLVTILVPRALPVSETARLAIGVGFLGAFTTFSAFELETHMLIRDGSWLVAATYVAGSVIVGLTALRAGIAIAKAWLL
jgi:fluoride exporter